MTSPSSNSACPVVEPPVSPVIEVVTPSSDLHESAFGVTGMTCASCSAVVEKTVSRLAGVETASVNLATERLAVRYDPSRVDDAAIAEAVKKAGYGALPLDAPTATPATQGASGTVTLGIIGMTCSSCSAVIEKTLARVPGVASANVNLAAETATVAFDPAVVGLDTLIGAVKGAGYDAVLRVETPVAGEDANDAQRAAQLKHQKHERFLFAFSLALAIPAFLISMVPGFMTEVPQSNMYPALEQVLAGKSTVS